MPARDTFVRSANFNTALAAGGTGSAAEDSASGFAAPDAFADSAAPVPEPAAWAWAGTGAILLIAFRHMLLSWCTLAPIRLTSRR